MNKIGYLLLLFLFVWIECRGTNGNDYLIGGQVFIEPGQTPEQIDNWFRLLNESGMTVCRIRMFEEYMRNSSGEWDFSLFDSAFRAADKYHIKVFATLFPSSKNNSVGGFKFPECEEHQKQIAHYIEKAVPHFKSFSSLYGWVLVNEPGTGGYIPNTEFMRQKFAEWKSRQQIPEYNSKGYTLLVNFDKKKFLTDMNIWYLNWLAGEIKKYDQTSEIHVNNHAIFDNVAEYDFPAWRSFLTSLGGSAHPSWHFGYFDRAQYSMALAANCEIIRSGAGNLPFWITELQGGNNTYSGNTAICPTGQEITQWLWTSIGSGVTGIIFWSFNPRSIGEEAGEWALLDFQNQPSDRLNAAKNVIETLNINQQLFETAKPVKSPISILYIRESLWVEKHVQYGERGKQYEGRQSGGVMKSALAYYEILAENGIKSNFQAIDEYDWSKNDYTGECIILANQVALPSRYWHLLENFVTNGGKLIVDGLTAYYDENMLSLNNTGFPLQQLFGGALSEVICIPGDFNIPFSGKTRLPVNLWKSYIYNQTGNVLASEKGQTLATRNQFGKGTVIWIPALAGLGAWRTQDKQALSGFLRQELQEQIARLPFVFTKHHKGMLMQTLKSDKGYITVLINKGTEKQTVTVSGHSYLPVSTLFFDKKAKISKKNIYLSPEETIVIHWK